jgi:hypothetical protein
MRLFLLAKIPFFRRFSCRRLVLGGLLLGAWPLAGRAQTPVFGPAVVVGTYVGTAGSSVVASTALDAQGYVYVAGSFSGTVQFGSTTLATAALGFGQNCGFVAKLDGAGAYQWVRPVGGLATTYGGGLAVDASGNVTLTGSFYGPSVTMGPYTLTSASAYPSSADGFVARLDTNGNWQWVSQVAGPGNDNAGRPVLDAAGNVYISGGFAGATVALGSTVLANAGSSGTFDVFVAKLDAQGNWLWARRGGGSNEDGINSLAVEAGGNVYITGLVQGGAATFGPFTTTSSLGNADVLVAKLDAAGNWLWIARGGGSGIDHGTGIALDAAGNAYIAGHFDGPTATFGPVTLTNANPNGPSAGYRDVLVAKLDAAGAWQWAVRAGGPDSDSGGPIALDAAGRLVVAGTFNSSTAQFGSASLPNTGAGLPASGGYLPSTLFLAHLDLAGAWLGVATSQGGAGPVPSWLAPDAYGNVSLSGSFEWPTLGLGATTLAGHASATGFVTLVPMLPTIYTFAPGSGAPGTVVAVTGTGFAGVTQVLFNGIPAPSFAVQSTTRLLATVPAGTTAGPVSVRTSSTTGTSGTPFQPVVLATTSALATEAVVGPNPAAVGEAWQLRLPAAFGQAPVRAEVRNLLGQLVFQAQLSGQAASLPVPRLAPGVYQLALVPAGQPALQRRVVVAD